MSTYCSPLVDPRAGLILDPNDYDSITHDYEAPRDGDNTGEPPVQFTSDLLLARPQPDYRQEVLPHESTAPPCDVPPVRELTYVTDLKLVQDPGPDEPVWSAD